MNKKNNRISSSFISKLKNGDGSVKNFTLNTLNTLLLLIIGFVLFMVSCEYKPKEQIRKDLEQSLDIIATVDVESITMKAFKKEMARRGGHIPGRFDALEQKEALLNEMIRFKVLACKAKKKGYDKDPEIAANLKKMMVQKLLQDQMETRLKDLQITGEGIEAYYKTGLWPFLKNQQLMKAAYKYWT